MAAGDKGEGSKERGKSMGVAMEQEVQSEREQSTSGSKEYIRLEMEKENQGSNPTKTSKIRNDIEYKCKGTLVLKELGVRSKRVQSTTGSDEYNEKESDKVSMSEDISEKDIK